MSPSRIRVNRIVVDDDNEDIPIVKPKSMSELGEESNNKSPSFGNRRRRRAPCVDDDDGDIPIVKPKSMSSLGEGSNSKSPSFGTRKGKRAALSPTRSSKQPETVKVPTANSIIMETTVSPKTTNTGAVPNRRVRSMSPSKIRAAIMAYNSEEDDIIVVKPVSMSSNITRDEERKPSSLVTRKGKNPTSKRPPPNSDTTTNTKKTTKKKKGKVSSTNASTKAASKIIPPNSNRRVRSMSPGKVRDSVTPSDDSSTTNTSMRKPKSTSSLVRKRGSSADPTKPTKGVLSTADDSNSIEKGRQTLRRGVRPKAVKSIAQKQVPVKQTFNDDTNLHRPSTLTLGTTTDHPVAVLAAAEESTIEKKKRVKERLAKRRAQQRLESAKNADSATNNNAHLSLSASTEIGLATFLHQEKTTTRAESVLAQDDDYDDDDDDDDDDARTAQSSPL
jgi:hypothetical protein